MNEYTLALVAYGFLQVASLAFLPKWWKLAAIPALWLVPEIVSEQRRVTCSSSCLPSTLARIWCSCGWSSE